MSDPLPRLDGSEILVEPRQTAGRFRVGLQPRLTLCLLGLEVVELSVEAVPLPGEAVRVGSSQGLPWLSWPRLPARPSAGRLPPRSAASAHERIVPLPRFLCDVLAGHLARRRHQLARPLVPDDYVFVGVKGQPLHRQFLRNHVVRPALAAAGLPKDFRTYDLRHAHAFQLIDMGASPLAIKERLGHTDVLTSSAATATSSRGSRGA